MLKFPRVQYLRHDADAGTYGNIERLARPARGRFIWALGDDDLIFPEAVRRIIAAIEATADAVVIGLGYAAWRPKSAPAANVAVGALPSRRRGQAVAAGRHATLDAILLSAPEMLAPLYTFAMRREHWLAAAAGGAALGHGWTSLESTVPHSLYMLTRLLDQPAHYVRELCVLGNFNIGWSRNARCWRRYRGELQRCYRESCRRRGA